MSQFYTLPASARVLLTALVLALCAAPVTAQTGSPAAGDDLFIPRAGAGASADAYVSGLCIGCSVNGEDALVADLAAFATIRTTVGAGGSASVAVSFPLEQPAGRFAGFALRDVVGLVDAQLLGALTVSTYSNGTLQESASGAVLLRLGVLSSDGVRTVSFETGVPFDEVRLTVGGLATIATETRVYYAFSAGTAQPAVVVSGGVSVGAGTTGICAGCLILTPGAAVDIDLTNGATVTVPGAASGSAYLDVMLGTTQAASVRVGFVVSSTLSDADLLAAVTVRTFSGGTALQSATGAALTVRALGDGSGRRVVEFTATASFDAVRLELAALPGGVGTSVVVGFAFTGSGATASEGTQTAATIALTAAPNPTAGSTALTFSLGAAGPARLAVYDALGREVAVPFDGEATAGETAVRWDTSGLPAGVYVVRLETNGYAVPRRITVIR